MDIPIGDDRVLTRPTSKHVIWLLTKALTLLWTVSTLAAGSVGVQVDRLDRGTSATPAAQVISGALDRQFKPQTYIAITPDSDHAIWYRLRLTQDWSAERPPILSIADPQGLEVEVYVPPSYLGSAHSIYSVDPGFGLSRHSLAIALPVALKAYTSVYLRVEPGPALPHEMDIQDGLAAQRADLANARLDVLFPAIQLASLLIMLAFFMALREGMYGYFVGHVLFLVLYELYEFGIGYEFPPFNLLAPLHERPTWLIAAIAGIFLCQFSRRFLDLNQSTPRIDRLLALVVWPLGLLGVCALLPGLSHNAWFIDALLLMFLLLAALLLIAAVQTWHHGSRLGGVYLCAWLPGLLVVIVRALQLMAQWPQPAWLELALPAAFAFASIVLAFGLAEHTLAVRHERDVAHRLAEHDMLTGALNRRAIMGSARAAFRNAREAGESLVLCLRAIAAPINDELRRDDALGRYGGEEFLVVLPRTTASEAEAIAECIRRRVQGVPIDVSGTRIGITVSVGVAVIDDEVLTVEDLIEYADAALYQAKSIGRNTVSTYRGPTGGSTRHVRLPSLTRIGTDDTPST